jgi:DNA-binding transcriptional ArsR family regulator
LLLGLLEFGYARIGCDVPETLAWYEITRARLSADVVSAFDELAPRCWLWHGLLFLAREMRTRRQAVHSAQFIEQVRSMDAQHLFEFLLGCRGHSDSITPALVQQAVIGNAIARLKIGKAVFPDEPDEHPELVRFLAMPSRRVKELLLRIINGWYLELLRNDERELAVRLASEARTKRIIGGSSPSRLLRASAIGLHYLPRSSVRTILLVPSIVCRPSIITIRFGRTRFFFYPLPIEGPDGEELQVQLVKIHRALADEGRLRILRALIQTDKTVEGLSRELGQSPQLITAQLIILRDAGLVTLRMDERRMSFEIRRSLPSVVFRTLQDYLR